MIISIKPHSSIQKFFRGSDLKADISHYGDILEYIQSMHPAFMVYIKKQAENGLQETFTFLDKNLREINTDEMFMRKAREDDIVYIVPSIVGGGGKRGILAILAVAALALSFPLWAPAGLAGATVLGTSLTTIMSTVGLNLALMGVSMLMMPKQKNNSETSRDNDAFGSLTNTTSSGTPIALNYGHVRVAGQLLTGYIKTVEVDIGEELTLAEIITST